VQIKACWIAKYENNLTNLKLLNGSVYFVKMYGFLINVCQWTQMLFAIDHWPTGPS